MNALLDTNSPVMLVEDNPGDADYIIELLSDQPQQPAKILHVATLAEAMVGLGTGSIRAVLLDLRLPDGEGVECVNRVRSVNGNVPIVVLTGTNDEALALKCIAAGAQDYLSKQEVKSNTLRRALDYSVARTRELFERRRADALQHRLADIVEASHDAIVSTNLNGVITSWNTGAELVFGYSASEAQGAPIENLLPPSTGSAPLWDASAEVTEEGMTVRKDGVLITLSVVPCRLRDADGRPYGEAFTCRDVTEKRRQEAEIQKRNEQLVERDRQMRALAARLQQIREEERTRISREVHDELGQLLTGLKMDLRWIQRRLNEKEPVMTSAVERLIAAEELIDATVRTVQRIAVELRPSVLDSLGLAPAIRDEARRFTARTSVQSNVSVEDIEVRSPDARTALFRIFQELLTNVARHASATKVDVSLKVVENDLIMHVEDDGIGLKGDEMDRSTSLGLLGMHERAAALDGTIELGAGQKGGTAVTVRIPRAK